MRHARCWTYHKSPNLWIKGIGERRISCGRHRKCVQQNHRRNFPNLGKEMLIQVQEAHSKQDEKINSYITLQLKL